MPGEWLKPLVLSSTELEPELGPIVGIGCHPRGIEHDFMQYEDRSVFRMTSLDVVAEDVTYIVGVLLMLAVFDVMVKGSPDHTIILITG